MTVSLRMVSGKECRSNRRILSDVLC